MTRTEVHRRAFSLVELLVVVAIIVALLAILLPSVGKAVAMARTAMCLSNIHQQAVSMLNYHSDNFGIQFPQHRDYAPYAISNYQDSASVDPATGFNLKSWHYALFTYIPDSEVLLCPVMRGRGGVFDTTRFWVSSDTTYGGWDSNQAATNAGKKHARWVSTPYDWYGGFTDYWNQRPTFPADSPEWPIAGVMTRPNTPIIGHPVIQTLTQIQDRSHGGQGNVTGTLNTGTSTDVPLGYADGSVELRERSQWRARATWHQGQFTAYY